MRKHRRRYVVGIDPGQTTALVTWDRHTKRWLDVFSGSFWDVVDRIEEDYYDDLDLYLFVVEDPGKISTIYNRHRRVSTARLLSIAQKVGMNKADATRLLEYLHRRGFHVRPVVPASGPKWDRKVCERITGWKGSPNNQHTRDAMRLVYDA